MKKLRQLLILIVCFISLSVFDTGTFNVKVNAETLDGSKLQYFELDKPISVWREQDKVYIAQQQLIVIYQNDTYTKIELNDFEVSSMKKCGSFLLILSKGVLFSINIETHEVKPLEFECESAISSFAVKGNHLVICSNQQAFIYKVDLQNENDFTFNAISQNSKVELVANSSLVALDQNLNLYYHSLASGQVYVWEKQSGKQGPCQNLSTTAPDCFFYADKFYYKDSGKIYSLESDNAIPQTVCDLSALNILNDSEFFVENGLILICDTANDRVVEYDVIQNQLTDFEISFTKITIPQNFTLKLNQTPDYIQINAGTILYDINLKDSQNAGYFVFNGYHEQEQTQDYLVVSEISNTYYLIAGEKIALVLKSDFEKMPINLITSNNDMFITTKVNAYLLPYLSNDFISFNLEKHSVVKQLCYFEFEGVNYSLISSGEQVGYLPSSFLVKNLFSLPEFNEYKTATITNRNVKVYSDSNFTTQCDTLLAGSSVVIAQTVDGGYQIIYGNGKTGYVLTQAIRKKGEFVNRNVTAIILLSIAFAVTAVYFEIKYLYQKRKLSSPTRRKK